MSISIGYGEKQSAFGGSIVMSRSFYNPATGYYLCIEAHQVIGDDDHLALKDGEFEVAFWVPDGNDGDHGFAGPLEHVVKSMQEFVPPYGVAEMAIPKDAWQ